MISFHENTQHNKGRSFREISRIAGLSHVTVSRWVRSGTFLEMLSTPRFLTVICHFHARQDTFVTDAVRFPPFHHH